MISIKSFHKVFLTAIALTLAAFTSEVWSQDTYWMVRKPANDNKVYYDTQVPAYFAAWIAAKSPNGETRSYNGQNWQFHTLNIAWDNGGSNPKNQWGQIRINDDWKNHNQNDWGVFRDKLYELNPNNSGWTILNGVEFIKTNGTTPPNLVLADHAKNMQAKQSTTNGINTADKAVDAKQETVSETNGTTAPWWQVDLGNRYSVSEITLTPGWKDQLKNFVVIFSDNPFPDVAYDYEISFLEQHAVKAINVTEGEKENFKVQVSPAVTGRYVRIQRRAAAGGMPLGLKNITMMGAPDVVSGTPPTKQPWPVNLAAKMKAEQSSTHENYIANKAVDDENNSSSITNWSTAPWWQVDLGNRYSVTEINLAIGSWENDLKDFYVIFSDNEFPKVALDHDISVLEKYAVKAIRINQGITANFKVPVSPAVTARYVRIQRRTAAGDKPLDLKNIAMMGAPNPISGSGPTKLPWVDLFAGGAPYDPSVGKAYFQDSWKEYPSTRLNGPQIIAHPNGDGSFDVAWQDMTSNSKKIFISRYNQSGGNYMKDAGNSKSMEGLGFLAGFTKGGGHHYVMTSQPWSDRSDVTQVKVFKDNNVLWVGKKFDQGCKDIGAMLMGGSARLALAGNNLMAEFNTSPTHPYQVILDVNSTNQNADKCSYQKFMQHCFDNDVLFDGTDFVVMEKLDHDIGIGMMKFSPSATGPFTYQMRSVYAHTNFGNGTFMEFGDFQPGLSGGYLLLFASERDWDNKMTGYFHNQPHAPEVLSPLDIALVHVKKDFDQEELNWKNKAGTGASQAPAVVDNSNMVNSNGTGKTVTYPSANDGWDWNNYNCCGVRDEIAAGMTTRQQITSGVKWLTTYGVPYETAKRKGNSGEQFTCVRFPKLVKISSTEYIALWEEHNAEIGKKSKAYVTTKATKITLSANGSKVDITNGTIKDIGQVRLMPDDDAFELSGKAAWIIGNKDALTLKLYTVDGSLNLSTYDLGL